MRLNGTVFSSVLGMDTGITIVTPNALRMDKPYKVVYLLHGIAGNHASWLDYSMLPAYTIFGNSIFIMPEVGRSFYTNMQHGFSYFTYITQELPRICKNMFHISAAREDTIIMGASMGGYGALKCALSIPEQYGTCIAFSSACLQLRQNLDYLREHGMHEQYRALFGDQLVRDFEAIFGDDYTWNAQDDILELAKQVQHQPHKPTIYMACGTSDYFYADHIAFSKQLETLSLDFTFEQWQAQHDFTFFNDALKKVIDRFAL